jgi:ABC-2 type transport system permease protein
MASAGLKSEIRNPHSVLRAFGVIAAHTFSRHWRVRQMGWVALALLGLVVASVAVVGQRPGGWDYGDRNYRRTGFTYRQYAEAQLPQNRFDAGHEPYVFPKPWDPTANAVQSLLLSIPHAVMQSEKFHEEYKFLNFSRWVVLGSFLGFVLPLFTLAYSSAAIGAERESRTLVWLLTRPVPRSAIYLATFVGTLPWCLLFGVGGFAALCIAGGPVGQQAFTIFWPAAIAGTIALASLFQVFGMLFRRPIVVGLVYVFFYEALVAALPGSLKKFSLNFYTRSLMHDESIAAGYPGAMLDVSGPVSATTAWATLLLITVALTTLGMVLFARREQRDDV